MRAAVKAIDDVSIEPAFYRIPVEVWCDILHYATTSPLFPFSEDPDGHSLLSSLSIIHTPYLFGINWNIFPVSMLYLNYGMYACHQRRITRLRQVCHLWDEIIEQSITPQHQWSFLSNRRLGYPPSSRTTPQRPQLVLIEEYSGPFPTFFYSEQDLSRVRIAILGRVYAQTKAIDVLTGIPSLRALSVMSFDSMLSQLLFTSSLMNKLTHLHLFKIMNYHFTDFQQSPLSFPNLRYLALHFDSLYFSTPSAPALFPSWKLERLKCLSVAVQNIRLGAEEILGILFERLSSSGSNTISELLLDFYWWQNPEIRTFWELVWAAWFPHLTVLGCPAESLDAVISSLLSRSNDTTPQRNISLFLLEADVFGSPRSSTEQNHNFDVLDEAYQVGHLERIYIPTSNPQLSSIKPLIKYCIEHKIPVYDAEGWQVYEVSLP
jgi:hypothetical protein